MNGLILLTFCPLIFASNRRRVPIHWSERDNNPMITTSIVSQQTTGGFHFTGDLYLGFATVGAIQVPICDSRAYIAIRLGDDATTDELPIECWTTSTNESFERQSMVGKISLDPTEWFYRYLVSFLITPYELIIQPSDPAAECPEQFRLVDVHMDETPWGWYIDSWDDLRIQINTFYKFKLPRREYRDFVGVLFETFQELDRVISLAMGENGNRITIPSHCDIEELDDILPILSFTVLESTGAGDLHHLEFTARDYLRREIDGSCSLDISESRDESIAIGSPLFRKYSVYFAPSRIGICLPSTIAD